MIDNDKTILVRNANFSGTYHDVFCGKGCWKNLLLVRADVLYYRVMFVRALLTVRWAVLLPFLLVFFALQCTVCAKLMGAVREVTIVIEGLSGVEQDNVQKVLEIPAQLIAEGVIDDGWLERYTRSAQKRVARALEPFGYFSPEITTRLERVSEEERRFVVRVEPGRAVVVEDVKVEITGPGALEPSLRELIASFPLQRGSRLRQDLYEIGKGEVQRKAIALGYLDADYTEHVIQVSLGDLSAHVKLVLNTGMQYRFGEVTFTGTHLYPNSFLRRYLDFKAGEIYSQEKLARTQYNFAGADRFNVVAITGKKELAEGDRVPVEISLSPLPPKRLRFGIGYATDTGLRGLVRYQDFNLGQMGHVLDTELKLSQIFQGLGVRYILPSTLDIRSYSSLKLTWEREDTNDKKVQYVQLEGAYTRSLGLGKLGSVFLKMQHEDSEAGNDQTRTFIVLPGIRYAHQHYDNLIRPAKGFRYDVELRGTDGLVGSNASFIQILTSGEILVPLPGRLTVQTRMRIGATTDREAPEDIPISLRFFAGGDTSVRGYKYQSLGPRDSSGTVVGGRHLFFGSVEVERAIRADWGVAGFYDTGNAFNNWSKLDLAQGIGIGVRYYTVVGPIRLDLARQINVKKPDFRIHFTVGIGL